MHICGFWITQNVLNVLSYLILSYLIMTYTIILYNTKEGKYCQLNYNLTTAIRDIVISEMLKCEKLCASEFMKYSDYFN